MCTSAAPRIAEIRNSINTLRASALTFPENTMTKVLDQLSVDQLTRHGHRLLQFAQWRRSY